MSRHLVAHCFEARNVTRVCLVGDSLIRELYNALERRFGGKRVASLAQLSSSTDQTLLTDLSEPKREFSLMRPDGIPVTIKYRKDVNFTELAEEDVVVANLAAQHLMWTAYRRDAKTTLSSTAEAFQAMHRSQQRIFYAGIYPHSLRQSYIFPS